MTVRNEDEDPFGFVPPEADKHLTEYVHTELAARRRLVDAWVDLPEEVWVETHQRVARWINSSTSHAKFWQPIIEEISYCREKSA